MRISDWSSDVCSSDLFSPLREPIANNDIRRWVHAMQYPNLLHYDPEFAAEGRWGKLVAPQSFPIATDDGHGAAPACVGRSEERRVGQECVSTCRSRWAPSH